MRKNKWLGILVVFLFFSVQIVAQKKDSVGLATTMNALNIALVKKDVKVLDKLLNKKLSYAHSNGWIETKKELLQNLGSGKFVYLSIRTDAINIGLEGNTGVVKTKNIFKVILKEKNEEFPLNVTQIWQWKKGKWVLMSRQSVKMD